MKQKLLAADAHCWAKKRNSLLAKATLVLLILLLVIVPLHMVFISSANAQAPQVTLEVSPQEVKLPSKDGVVAIAILRNPSTTDPLQNVRLTSFAGAGVKVVPQEPTELENLPPGADHAWTLRVTQTGEGPMADTIRLRVDYDWVAVGETTTGEPRIVPQTRATSLAVTDLTPPTLEELAKAEIQTGFGSLGPVSLSHERPGTVYLSVSNVSKMPVTIMGVLPKRPENIIGFDCERTEFVKKSCKLRGDDGILVGPKEKLTIPIEVEPTERVTPGRYVLLFEIPIDWGWPGTEQRADLFAKQEISVEVFGESQILGALQLPSQVLPVLLVLPGFLMLGVWALLWRFLPLSGDAGANNSFPIGKGDLAFYIVALTLSLVFILVYSLITKHDFLQSYGFSDIVVIWFVSIALGCASYFVVWGVSR